MPAPLSLYLQRANESKRSVSSQRVSGSLRAHAAHDGCGWPASASELRAIQRIGGAGIDGSALDIAKAATALSPSCENAIYGNWRKSTRDKSLEFTGFHYKRL
jgi:hypothetical protein